jgi:hypothetical protein
MNVVLCGVVCESPCPKETDFYVLIKSEAAEYAFAWNVYSYPMQGTRTETTLNTFQDGRLLTANKNAQFNLVADSTTSPGGLTLSDNSNVFPTVGLPPSVSPWVNTVATGCDGRQVSR